MVEDLRQTLMRLRKEFKAAHAKGMAALKSGDYRAFDEAINAERKIFDQQKSLFAAHMRARDRRR
jgi:hypothetical protein